MSRRCVITGAGVVSPLGVGLEANREALREARAGIGPITAFAAAGFPVAAAGEVHADEFARDAARPEIMARAALAEALAGAGLTATAPRAEATRRALSFAIGKPPLDLEALAAGRALWRGTTDPSSVLRALPSEVAARRSADPTTVLARLARAAGAGGVVIGSYTACASGNDAIGLGKRMIERDEADVVIVGATDNQVHPLSMLEFELLSALSHEPPATACRPFDRSRTGFVVGEGAAVLVLEAEEHAQRRGARTRAFLAGYGSSMDSFGLTKCHPQGRGAALAMRAALLDAGLTPRDVDYLNAHGTGTVLNDQAEAAAIRQIWGADTRRLPVSSTKAMTGHLLTAASAVEAVFALLALEDRVLPPNLNYEHFDPECDLNLITAPLEAEPRVVMSNGFGFGGQNSCLILAQRQAA